MMRAILQVLITICAATASVLRLFIPIAKFDIFLHFILIQCGKLNWSIYLFHMVSESISTNTINLSTVWLFSDFLRYGKEALIESKITTFVQNHWPNARQTVLFFIVLTSLSFIYRYFTSGISVYVGNDILDNALLYTMTALFILAIGIWFYIFKNFRNLFEFTSYSNIFLCIFVDFNF